VQIVPGFFFVENTESAAGIRPFLTFSKQNNWQAAKAGF
jgi:hypothetical protein